MTDLPPKPDRQTGEPRPPEAPREITHDGANERTPSRLPEPPEGKDPVLEHYRESSIAVWLTAPIPPLLLLLAGLWHSGPIIFNRWFTWAFLAGFLALLVYKGRRNRLTAGVDWIQYNNHSVRTYELTRIHYVPAAQGARWDLVLDESDHGIVIPIKVVQSNKRLWNCVYLGMRHSGANGAEITRSARSQFPELVSTETY